MKTVPLKLIVFVLFISINVQGQTLTTYYFGFDTPNQRAGWTQCRKASQSGSPWALEGGAYSTATCLTHYYPVTSSAPTEDWYVSPVFNFGAGGNIDSLRTNFSGFGAPGSGDTVAIILLTGSADPALATRRTKLFEFRGNDFANDGLWKLKTNITIPPMAGNCYIAFKYNTTNNWLDIKFDNLAVKRNSTVGVEESDNKVKYSVFPVPSPGYIYVASNANTINEKLKLKVFNALGELIINREVESNSKQELSQVNNGIYVYEISDANGKHLDKGRIIVKSKNN